MGTKYDLYLLPKKMQKKFLISDVPPEMCIKDYIVSKSKYREIASSMKPKLVPPGTKSLVFKNTKINHELLWQSVQLALEQHGEYGWLRDDQTGNTVASEIYTGFSLMYNPEHTDVLNKHQSSLGTGRMVDFKLYENNIEVKKNTYLDTLGFRLRTPASTVGHLGEFFDSFKLSMTRGRMSIIHADKFTEATQLETYGWHYDEPIFENLRLNIPLYTDSSFKFQIKGEQPYHLELGKSYSWDTSIMHRVYPTEITNKFRAHLVIGISPWFNYDPIDDSWNMNEYFGEVHPYDLLISGKVVDGREIIDYR